MGASLAETSDVNEDDGRRRPGRPRDPNYDKVILDATLEILFEKGYAGLTIDGVAAKTGVGRPTIYRRWASKPALVIAAIAGFTGLSPAPDTGNLRDDLVAFQRQVATLMDAPASRRITAGLVADIAADPQLSETYLRQYIAPRQASVWQALQRARDRGELRPDIDFSLIYDVLLGSLFMRSVVRGERLGTGLAEQTVDLVLAAVATDPLTAPGEATPSPAPRTKTPSARTPANTKRRKR
jgi:AcrR family transcriptional regulator